MEQSLSAASPAGGYDAIPNGKNRKRHDSTKAPIGLSGSNLALAGYPAGGHISPAPGAPGNAGKPAPECDGQGPSTNSGYPSSQYRYRRWCGVRRSTWLFLFYITSYVAYLVVGAWAMWFLEVNNETLLRREAFDEKRFFLEKYPQLKPSDLEEFLSTAMAFKEKGISVLDKDKDQEIWQYGQGLLYTVTVVTTIGYGHVAPLTNSGMLFTVLYAVLGIPFTCVFLTVSVQRLLDPTVKVLAYLFQRLGSRIDPFTIRLIHLFSMTAVFAVFFLVLPATLFMVIEGKWNWIESFYFVFISLTTIGLGDYIPGDNFNDTTGIRLYKISVAIFLLLGLVFMTLTATVYYDIPQLNFGNVLHQHQDIHLPGESDYDEGDDEHARLLKDSIKKITSKVNWGTKEEEAAKAKAADNDKKENSTKKR